ncbi:INT5 protein, partial [Ardeotis kori]|nr:INT5 protein [Ardeotis kori]
MPASVITPPAAPPLHAGVREACDRLLQLLLFRLQKSVYERGAGGNDADLPPPPRCVPFLEALKPHARDLCAETLRMERKRYVWQHRLLALLAAYAAARRGDAVGAESLAFLLTAAGTPEELGLAAQLHAGLVATLPRLLPAALHVSLRQIHAGFLPEKAAARFFRNLAAAA